MGFVTPLLLGGAALVALPIALHLVMRREAQQIRFPALRFVQQRRSLNQHRLRLRHLVLLALRSALIVLLATALARPTLRSAGAIGKENAPVATALVFDNSPHMEYRQQNRTRLEQAVELGAWLLGQLSADAPVTIVERGSQRRAQDLDRSSAELRLERLHTSTTVRPMIDALGDAMRWIEAKPDHRGEIYVFTDLSEEAWAPAVQSQFAARLDSSPGTSVYLIDVGAPEARNLQLGELTTSSTQLTPGALLALETELRASGALGDGESVAVELLVGDGSTPPEKRGQQSVELRSGRAAPVEFSISGLELGTHQGFVRILGDDPLGADDVRFFTVEVREAKPVLLLGTSRDATLFLREALAPSSAVGVVESKFTCDVATYDALGSIRLGDYAAVLLVDPPPLDDAAWRALVDFADAGGGVGVFLGRNARSEGMNGAAAQRLLPARLRWQSRDATYLRPVAVEHPALAELRELGTSAVWSEYPVFTYWELEGGAASARVVASYANGKPALVERAIGDGNVLMLTTPVSDPAHSDPWNLLPTGPEPWPFLVLANGIADYLTGAGDAQLNYIAGQTVLLPLELRERVASYVLQLPDGSALRQSVAPGADALSIASTDQPGNYRLRAGGREERLDRGFSINVSPESTQLERVDVDALVQALGDERTRVARTTDEIEVRVGQGRLGRELFPVLIVLVALVLAAEQWLANRFYRSDAPAVDKRALREREPIDREQPIASAV